MDILEQLDYINALWLYTVPYPKPRAGMSAPELSLIYMNIA